MFALLSERKLGPKLHGIFPGGRIEQYIPVCSWWLKLSISSKILNSFHIIINNYSENLKIYTKSFVVLADRKSAISHFYLLVNLFAHIKHCICICLCALAVLNTVFGFLWGVNDM